MEKRIIYNAKCTIKNLMLEAEKSMKICGEEIDEVYLMGLYCVARKESCSA